MLEVHQDHLRALADLSEFAEDPLSFDAIDGTDYQHAMTATALA